MTVSNAAAIICMLRWVAFASNWSTVALGVVLTATFVYFRQKPVIESALVLWRGKAHAE